MAHRHFYLSGNARLCDGRDVFMKIFKKQTISAASRTSRWLGATFFIILGFTTQEIKNDLFKLRRLIQIHAMSCTLSEQHHLLHNNMTASFQCIKIQTAGTIDAIKYHLVNSGIFHFIDQDRHFFTQNIVNR
jgi:hypothetical protein